MVKNKSAVNNIAQSLTERLQKIIPSLNKDGPQWNKVEEELELTIHQMEAEKRSLQDSLNRVQTQLELLSCLQNIFSSARDLHTVVLRTCELIPKYTNVDRAQIHLYNEHLDTLVSSNFDISQTNKLQSSNSTSPSQIASKRCYDEGIPIVINDLAATDIDKNDFDKDNDIKSLLLVPLIIEKHAIGVLQVDFTKQIHLFTQNEIDFFKLIAEKIAAAIGNIQLSFERRITQEAFKESEESYFQIYEDIPVGLFRSTPEGTFLRLNHAMVQILGYPNRETLLRTNASRLYADPQERIKWQTLVETYDIERESEICLRKYDGTDVWVQHSSRLTRGSDGKVLYYDGAIVDISGRKRAEVQIREAVKEKEVLLREIHHRVKNNLQIISSLLNLQSDYLRDPYDRELFKQSQNRVKAMALLHEKLYQSAEITRIDFEEYLRSLMPSLFQSYKTSLAAIDCNIEADGMLLDIDTAIPCGLIVGELVANSLKHAFPNSRAGCINVVLRYIDKHTIQLSVYDDGIGMKEGESVLSQGTPMGWELIQTLAEQLGGTIEIDRQPGTRVRITFKEKTQKEGTQPQWQIQKS